MKKLTAVANSKEDNSYDPRPTIEISEKDLPEIKKWNVDDEYELEIKVKMIGINEKNYGPDKGKKAATFRVISIGLEEAEEE